MTYTRQFKAPNTYYLFSSSINVSNLKKINKIKSINQSINKSIVFFTFTYHILDEFVPLLYYSISEPIYFLALSAPRTKVYMRTLTLTLHAFMTD